MKIEIQLAVISIGGQLYVDFIGNEETLESRQKYLNVNEKIVRICRIVMEDNEDGCIFNLATAYQALWGLNSLSDSPEVQEVFTFLFMEGFKEGIKHQTEQQAKLATTKPPDDNFQMWW